MWLERRRNNERYAGPRTGNWLIAPPARKDVRSTPFRHEKVTHLRQAPGTSFPTLGHSLVFPPFVLAHTIHVAATQTRRRYGNDYTRL